MPKKRESETIQELYSIMESKNGTPVILNCNNSSYGSGREVLLNSLVNSMESATDKTVTINELEED